MVDIVLNGTRLKRLAKSTRLLPFCQLGIFLGWEHMVACEYQARFQACMYTSIQKNIIHVNIKVCIQVNSLVSEAHEYQKQEKNVFYEIKHRDNQRAKTPKR